MAKEIVPNDKEKDLEIKLNKEIEKLKYYLEETDELIEEKVYKEIETVSKRSETILNEIYSLVSSMQKVKVDRGEYTARAIRQSKKSAKELYMPWASRLDKLQAVLTKRREDVMYEETTRKHEATRQKKNSTGKKFDSKNVSYGRRSYGQNWK